MVDLDCLLQLFELICSREVVKVAIQALDILRPGVGCSVCSACLHQVLLTLPYLLNLFTLRTMPQDGTQFRQHIEGDEPERPGGGISTDLHELRGGFASHRLWCREMNRGRFGCVRIYYPKDKMLYIRMKLGASSSAFRG